MFHNRTLNNKINKLHERALRIVYKDDSLTFSELLDKDEALSTHHRNLQKIAIEIYKLKHKLSPKPFQVLNQNIRICMTYETRGNGKYRKLTLFHTEWNLLDIEDH